MTRAIENFHDNYVHGRRVRRLGGLLSELIPKDASVLDVGCGDGWLARLMQDRRGDLAIRGIDVLLFVIPHTFPWESFDGVMIPADDKSVDVVMFVDVLHHTDDPMVLLTEAAMSRSPGHVVIKDHLPRGLRWPVRPSRFMDSIGNAHPWSRAAVQLLVAPAVARGLP